MSSLSAAPSAAGHRPVLADLIARPTARAQAFALDAGLVVAGAAIEPVKSAKTGRPASPTSM